MTVFEKTGVGENGEEITIIFAMRPAEIARMEGVKHPSEVRGLIIRVSDQLSFGEIGLFEKDPKEAEAAKARLEAKRAKRGEMISWGTASALKARMLFLVFSASKSSTCLSLYHFYAEIMLP